jgi:uncharacterized protein (DUF433 family)
MTLESYLEFLSEQDIRIKGTRIGIETVLEDFLDGASPEEIVIRYPNLVLEQVYAVITYYLAHRTAVDAYLDAGKQMIEAAAQAQERNPSPAMQRLRNLKAQRAQTTRQAVL